VVSDLYLANGKQWSIENGTLRSFINCNTHQNDQAYKQGRTIWEGLVVRKGDEENLGMYGEKREIGRTRA
jgi:hypothetical protein